MKKVDAKRERWRKMSKERWRREKDVKKMERGWRKELGRGERVTK